MSHVHSQMVTFVKLGIASKPLNSASATQQPTSLFLYLADAKNTTFTVDPLVGNALKGLLATTKLLVEALILVMSLATNISELCRSRECQAEPSPRPRPVGGS